jgi:site-specific recombinase XerD
MNPNQPFNRPSLVQMYTDAQDYVSSCRSDSTREAYQRDWNHFRQWCELKGLECLPAVPSTVAQYLTNMANLYKPITLGRRLASISVAHQMSGYASPTANILVRNTLSGIRRRHGVAATRKTPIRASNLRRAVGLIPDSMKGKRDRALLLLGYVGALRRSEIVAINAEDIEYVDGGIRLMVRRSKSDQEGRGVTMGIGYGAHPETCPVKALRAWMESAGIGEGPVFRPVSQNGRVGSTRLCPRTVALIIKALASKLGMEQQAISGHSLRAGFITDQYAAGTAEAVIMARSRHNSHSVMAAYRREADMFAFNYAAKVGL